MTDFAAFEAELKTRLADLLERSSVIEDDLRHPLDADSEEQAQDLADDEALAEVDAVLREEIQQIRFALARIASGTYGTCSICGQPIGQARLKAQPMATRCINCA